MPKLKTNSIVARQSQAQRVLALMLGGTSKEEALAEVGITSRVYDQWIATAPEAVSTLSAAAAEVERTTLANTLVARKAIHERLLDMAMNVPMPAQQLVAIDKHLKELEDELSSKHGTQVQTGAEQFLSKLQGPHTQNAESVFRAKFVQTTTEVLLEQRPSSEQTLSHDVIDGEFTD